MANILAKPIRKLLGIPPVNDPDVQEEDIAQGNLTGGMIADLNPENLQDNQAVLLKNMWIRDDKPTRRGGTILFTPAKPNSIKVLGVSSFINDAGANKIVRHTKSTVHYIASGWQNIAPAIALNGGDTDLFKSFSFLDDYYFFNNGKDPIQKIDFGLNTCAKVGNAPTYKRYFTFFNRIVGINLQNPGTSPIQVGWSGDLNPTVWDTVTDISAGSVPLADSSEDESDFLVDGVGFDDVAVIIRQRSVWFATKQASASNPFYFFNKFPGVGCTCPFSVAHMPNGVIFFDIGTRDIWVVKTDGNLESIGFGVRRQIAAAIQNPDTVFSSFKKNEREFTICVQSTATAIVKEWTYSFISKSWVYAERDSVTCIEDLNNGFAALTIDELIGTIDGLSTSIDGLATPTPNIPRRVYGRSDGEILAESDTIAIDQIISALPSQYVTDIQSKVYDPGTANLQLAKFYSTIKPSSAGTIQLYFSKDEGNTFTLVHTFTISSNDIGKPITLMHKKMYVGGRVMWRLVSSDCQYLQYNYYLKGYKAAQQTR
jgi:hypothetical protein